MSITNYSELQTAAARWLARADLTTLIPDFITFAEAKFNRTLRTAEMETRLAMTLDEEYEDLPADYLEMRRLKVTGSDGRSLQYVTPEVMNSKNPTSAAGRAYWYTIIGSEIQFANVDSASLEMVYYAQIPALSASNTTNWLLTKYPDAYLYGTLLEAQPYIRNDARIAVWQGKLEETVGSIMGADVRARHSGPLVMRLA